MKITIERKEACHNAMKGSVFLNSMVKLCDCREPISENAIPPGHYFLELQHRRDGKLVPYILLCEEFPVATLTDSTRVHPLHGTIQLGYGSASKPLTLGDHYLEVIVRAMLEAEMQGEPTVLYIR